ncbi:methylated-DNA--[protein]-cysteine S-methyltransferase [Kitasatospora sp. McL0602]|uniref:methylated-DNA--[protein]-cysteine S-methyltransferase n=1 Tax=Kitasatospora sp. McL0602 TaxID=3439530 RepID=UPI003F892F31
MTLYTTLDSPIGELLLTGLPDAAAPGGLALTGLTIRGQRNALAVQGGWTHLPSAFAEPARQLAAYFTGELRDFELTLATRGTDFQERVWAALDGLPYGSTTAYGRLAAELGVSLDGVQALGGAVGANPVLLVRPCHRVIGADGTLRGYAGGVERKQHLLAHEGALEPMLF